MNINIDKAVEHLVPKEFNNFLEDVVYRLTKIENTRPLSMVQVGDFVIGTMSIVDIADMGVPGVKVMKEVEGTWGLHYLRTSPIVQVLDASESKITFQTQGGTYLLEKYQ